MKNDRAAATKGKQLHTHWSANLEGSLLIEARVYDA
jgi:hypothetical protein